MYQLTRFLREKFRSQELRLLLSSIGVDGTMLPNTGVSWSAECAAIVEFLDRRSALDDAFFDRLVDERPRLVKTIDELRARTISRARELTHHMKLKRVRQLGENAFTTTWLCTSTFGKLVMKEIHAPGPSFDNTLRRAMEYAGWPYFIDIYGASSDGERAYVLMQYVEENLGALLQRKRVKGRRLRIESSRHIFLTVAEAVNKIHTTSNNTVALGNIKASNIYLIHGDPIISPFTHESFRPGRLRGFPLEFIDVEDVAYLAPELHTGRGVKPQKCDQYALGVLAYHMLTGTLPVTICKDEISSPDDIREIRALLTERGRDAYRELDMDRLALPRRIREVLRRMTSLYPEERYDSLSQAIDEIRNMSRKTLFIARDSYVRCMQNSNWSSARSAAPAGDAEITAEDRFYREFYRRAFENQEIVNVFNRVEGFSIEDQYRKLRESVEFIFLSFNHSTLDYRHEDGDALAMQAIKHARLRISDSAYRGFVDALVETICGDQGPSGTPPFDPRCLSGSERGEIEEAWRALMKPIVELFKRP